VLAITGNTPPKGNDAIPSSRTGEELFKKHASYNFNKRIPLTTL
jgi:hypothetical protein